MSNTLALVCFLAAAGIAQAQTPPDLSTQSAGLTSMYRAARANLVEAAEAMPEEHYSFKPSDDVRTFGQIVGHVANANYNLCRPGRDVDSPNKTNLEQLASKAELVAALKASFDYCDPAYEGLTDAIMAEPAKFGQTPITKGYALTFNVVHDNEHYGNVATYLRMKGVVPPSTARRRR
jgi:uncharacterized damage-inducible protein DinB